MAIKFHYDEDTGDILGIYNDGFHSTIPSPTISVTIEEHHDYLDNCEFRKINLSTLGIDHLPTPMTTLELAKRDARVDIDQLAERIRLMFITRS